MHPIKAGPSNYFPPLGTSSIHNDQVPPHGNNNLSVKTAWPDLEIRSARGGSREERPQPWMDMRRKQNTKNQHRVKYLVNSMALADLSLYFDCHVRPGGKKRNVLANSWCTLSRAAYCNIVVAMGSQCAGEDKFIVHRNQTSGVECKVYLHRAFTQQPEGL